MDFYLQRLHDAISSATEGMNPEMLGRRPQAGKWCAAEVLEHLYLTYTGTIKGVEKCIAAGRPLARGRTLNDRMRTALVVSIGYMPGGRQAPQNAMPRGIAANRVLGEFSEKICSMDAVISQAEEKFGPDVPLMDHPILGPLRACQWRKFHWVHGMHHLKQLQRLRQKLGADEPRATG
jgi:Protein of unknown function (DUF1569)